MNNWQGFWVVLPTILFKPAEYVPYARLLVMGHQTFVLAWILTSFLAGSAVVGLLGAPRNEGKSLEQLERERQTIFQQACIPNAYTQLADHEQ